MRLLITGAGGMLGRAVLQRLAADHEVIALARRDPRMDGAESVEWVQQDLTEPLDLTALPETVDAIVHLAQSQRYRDFPEGAEDLFEVNVHSTFRLLEYGRRCGAERFVLASTGGLYGPGPSPIGEEAPLVLAGPYFRSKRISELLLDDYADHLTGVSLRFFFIYGPGRGRTLVPRLAKDVLAGEEIRIQGEPGMRINPIYVDDAAAAVEGALGLNRSAVVNVAGEETATITDLVQALADALGRTARIRHEGEFPGDLVADTSRMHDLLGTRASTSLGDGLAAVARSQAGSAPSEVGGEAHGG
jgi:UDP-glucose 4-epimerase